MEDHDKHSPDIALLLALARAVQEILMWGPGEYAKSLAEVRQALKPFESGEWTPE